MNPAISIFRAGDRLMIVTPHAGYKDAIREIPGRQWHKGEQMWSVPATAAGAGEVRRKLGHEAMRCDDETLQLMAQDERQGEVMDLKTREELPPIPGVPPSELNPEGGGWLHQRQAFWFAHELDSSMLAMWMGTGKTLVSVRLADEWKADLVVVLCPVKVMRVWHREFRKWSDRNWIVTSKGKGRNTMNDRVRAAKSAIEQGQRQNRPVAIVVNYEAMWQGAFKDFLPVLGADVAIYDESHKIKAPGGKWSRQAARIGKSAKKRLAMTGTPMPSGPTALYGQFRALDPGIFGTNYRQYQARYFEMGGFENRQVIGFLDRQAQEAHAANMARIAYICGKDVLDLPPEMDLPPVLGELGPESRRHYRELEQEFVTFVEQMVDCDACGGSGEQGGKLCSICDGAGSLTRTGTIAVPNVLAKLIRLSQVTQGFLPLDTPGGERQMVETSSEKLKLLEDTLDDIGPGPEEPVVIFCRFRPDLRRLETLIRDRGLRYGEISGGREDALTPDATMREDVDVVGVQLQAGGLGIDLTRARYCIFYSMDYSLGDYQQSRDRVHRPGQTRETFYVFPTMKDTVDETVQAALAAKQDVVRACIHAAKTTGSLGRSE